MTRAIIISFSFLLASFSQEKEQLYDLTIIVDNIKDQNGKLMVAVFDSKEKYLEESMMNKSVDINEEATKKIKIQLPKGEYALAVFHDMNGNEELDKSFIGIPTEAFGFSNKSMGTFGPPSFKDTKFQVSGDTEVSVSLKHF